MAAVSIVSTGGVAAYAVLDTVGSIQPGIHLSVPSGAPATTAPPLAAAAGELNILLTGTDTRTGQGAQFGSAQDLAGSSGAGSNDVTMVLHVAADHRSAAVISIPRDLVTKVPACPSPNGGTTAPTTVMFNTTLASGGLSCVVQTAQELTGLTIPYAAEISFNGVIAMSNAIGGVTVCLATPVTDPYVGLSLPAGDQSLVGDQALAFLRSRHGVGDGSDLGRISNQQLFLSAMMRQVTSAGVLSNPLTLYSLAKAAVRNMQFSDTMSSPTSLVSLALALKSVPLGALVFVQYPTVPDPSDSNRVVADQGAVTALTAALSSGGPVTLKGTTGNATVAAPSAAGGPAATPSETSAPTAAPSAPAHVSATPAPLPTAVKGQTAAEQTCTRGNN